MTKYSFYRDIGKRILDVVVALFALLLLGPLLMLVGLLVRMKFGPPMLFRQPRPGRHGQVFSVYKFRTMTNDRDTEGNLLPDEDRLTSLGQFLRSTSVDELPELWNVLRGDMSLVGPRPLLVKYLELYTPEQNRRHEVRPGLTGWAQINGRNEVSWAEKFRMDVFYVDNISFGLDVKILAMTVWKTLRRDGIGPEGYMIMPEFTGTSEQTAGEKE